MSSLYVGNLDPNITNQEIERQFQLYGEILTVNVPRTSSSRGFAFVEFKDQRDALFAIYSWNGKFNWRVELSRNSKHEDKQKEGVKQSQRGGMKKNQVASTSIWKPVPPPPPPWAELPEDITAKILHKLGPIGMLWTAQRVCTTWRKICRDPTMWRVIDLWKLGNVKEIHGLPYNGIGNLCPLVVDLSQGHVTEINIEESGCYPLIDYIASCGQLKCLRIASCYDICFESLTKGLPLLEELHLQCTNIEKDGIEAIGQSCPMLKRFVVNRHGSIDGVVRSSDETLAIAEYMPELRHLQLFGNGMNNEALEAILNGCLKLESLDLRQCFNLDLEGGLGKRCAQQIKILRRPHDPIDDYGWDIEVPPWAKLSFSDWDSDSDSDYDYDIVDLDLEDYC